MRKLALLLTLWLVSACTPSNTEQIAGLEAALEPEYRQATVDSLLSLYRAAVDAHPEAHASNFVLLSKGAALYFDQLRQSGEALQWADEALTRHAEGQRLASPVGLMARMWNAYLYQSGPAARLSDEQAQTMRRHLDGNLSWVDTALADLERDMGMPIVKNKRKANLFMETAEGYAQYVVERDSNKAVDLYMVAAGLAKSIEKPSKALQLYFEVAEKHPSHPKAPTALFMMGHIYEDDLDDLVRAESAYKTFLERYPKDPDYADDAGNALKYLGKSPEELIEEFQKQQQ